MDNQTTNIAGADAPSQELTAEEINEVIKHRVQHIQKEFTAAFEFLKDYPRSITVFGSSRTPEGDEHYEKARQVAGRVAKDLGYAVITGGGGGIMEAANRGAFEAGGVSIGFNIKLPHEQQKNKYTTAASEMYYFFTRKVALAYAAESYIFFPGGYGTMDEFFEIATLVQTNKIPRIPLILVGEDYWRPVDAFIKKYLYEDHHAIEQSDMKLYHITEDEDEIINIIKSVPVRNAIRLHS